METVKTSPKTPDKIVSPEHQRRLVKIGAKVLRSVRLEKMIADLQAPVHDTKATTFEIPE